MARKSVLCLFDVDGTLTRPRQAIEAVFRSFLLDRVSLFSCLGLVSGSDYPKVIEQLGGEEVASCFDYVFCENGLVYYKDGELSNRQSIVDHLGESKLQSLINAALGHLSKVELPCKRGNFIEFRSGMINICPVGRSCSQAEREQFAQYDSEHKVRQQIADALKQEFGDSGLTFALGGQISIDVFPTGWDKTYCLRHLADAGFSEIHFFGDKTDPGGNDYEIYSHKDVIGHTVKSPEDTEDQLRKLFYIE